MAGVAGRRKRLEADGVGRRRHGRSPPGPAPARPRGRRTRRRRADGRCARAGSGRPGAARRPRETWTCRAGCSRTSTPAAPAWSRWMWLRSRWRMSASSSPRSARPSFSRGMHGGRAAVEERGPVLGLEQIAADDALRAEVVEVDRAERVHSARSYAAVRRRRGARGAERGRPSPASSKRDGQQATSARRERRRVADEGAGVALAGRPAATSVCLNARIGLEPAAASLRVVDRLTRRRVRHWPGAPRTGRRSWRIVSRRRCSGPARCR